MSIVKSRRVDLTTESISTIGRRVIEGTLDLQPVYQRDSVWNEVDQNEFLESIASDKIPTNIIFTIDTEKGVMRNLDGKQRCETIAKFYNNQIGYKTGENIIYYSKAPKKLKEARVLTPQEKIEIDNRKIFVAKYYDLTYQEQIDLFNSLNKGKPLTSGEKIAIEFENENLAIKFSNLFDSLKNEFKSLVNTNRKQHNALIMRMLYNFDSSTDPAYSSKTIKHYLNKLSPNEVDDLLKKFKPKIQHIMKNINWKLINKENTDLYIESILVFFASNFKKIKNHSKEDLTEVTKRIINRLIKNEDISERKNQKNIREIYNYFDGFKKSVFKVKVK